MGKQSNVIVEQSEVSSHPSSPASGYSMIYPKTDGEWWVKKSDGTTTQVTNQAGGVSYSDDPATFTGGVLQIITGTGDSWGAYLYAQEASDFSAVGAYTVDSNFDINVDDVANGGATTFSTSHELDFKTNGTLAAKLKIDQTLQLPAYGAGVLTSDGSGNITSVSGGSGITADEAIAYAIALG